MNDLIPNVGAGALLERTLLADDRAVRIGAIQTLDYSRAVVITHDKWKEAVGGIPQYAFLLATARETGGGDDDEVLLLRVEGTASLSLERDLQAVREESLRDALSRRQDPSPSVILDVNLDPFTKNRVSFTGLDCRIIGTFYEDGRDGKVVLEFGHDVDNFYATATYRVFKPIGEGLSAIASYIKPTDDPVEMVRVGAIRYSSTRRRTMIAKQDDIPVEVNVYDFIGNKTGMFGMTRMGKSNTMKTVAARVFAVSERRRAAGLPPVGQLILDPQGEYANPNLQDGTELAAIGPRARGDLQVRRRRRAGQRPPARLQLLRPRADRAGEEHHLRRPRRRGLGLCPGLRPGRLRRDRGSGGAVHGEPSSAEPGPNAGGSPLRRPGQGRLPDPAHPRRLRGPGMAVACLGSDAEGAGGRARTATRPGTHLPAAARRPRGS